MDMPPLDPGIEISLASEGMSKGIAQTDGPQVIGRVFVRSGAFQLGGQWKNITSSAAEGEASVFLSWDRKIGAVQLSAGAAVKMLTSVKQPTDDKTLELNAALSRKWGKSGLRASAVLSPNDLGATRRSLYAEGGLSFDLSKSLRVSANVGLRARERNPDYTAFNAGFTLSLGKVTLDARYYDTAQSELGEIYRNRGVVAGRLVF